MAVGRREDFLGRHVDDRDRPPGRGHDAGQPLVSLDQADGQIGLRSLEADRGEPPLIQRRRSVGQPRHVIAPGLHRVICVQPEDRRERLPEPLLVRFTEQPLCPGRARAGYNRPVDRAAGDRIENLRDVRHLVAPQPVLVDVGEDIGIRVAEHGDPGAPALDRLRRHASEPIRDEPERALGGVTQARGLRRPVPVHDAHVTGARGIRLFHDRPRDRRLNWVPGGDHDVLARLDVGADVDGELGEQLEIVRHRRPNLPQQLKQTLRVPRRGRLVFVHEIAIDACAGLDVRAELLCPAA